MLLTHDTNEITLSNIGPTGEFRIRNSAKAFSILSSGLYSNKIKAIIRELSTNALDSHVAAGKADVPFEVHLPSMLEPWFSVRDFGTGLDADQVTNIYTTYFESTKTNSNDYIGALGLGSKSPFSYTENFTVTAIKDGIKRIYSAFINDVGVPSIAEMSSELVHPNDTDISSNGVEVKFSVANSGDFNSFKYEAEKVFLWFKNKPNIIGVKFEHKNNEYIEKDIIPGIHLTTRSSYDQPSIAVMGNIAYPLDKISEPEKYFGDLTSLLKCGLVIEFGIGELDFAASREVLSFVPLTINSIKDKLEKLNKNLAEHFAVKADAIKNKWLRAQFLYNESYSRLYKSVVRQYVADTKFPLFNNDDYYGTKNFDLDIGELQKRGLSISGFKMVHNSFSKITKYSIDQGKQIFKIPVNDSTVFVLNDLSTGCIERAKYHFMKLGRNKTISVFCVSHTNKNIEVRKKEYKKLIKELYNPPEIIDASTLQKKPPRGPSGYPGTGIVEYVRKQDLVGYKWMPFTQQLSDNTPYYYVCLDGHTAKTPDGKLFHIDSIRRLMDSSGIPDIRNITIFGVRKSRIKEISACKNWVWIEDKLKDIISKLSDDEIMCLIAHKQLSGYIYHGFRNNEVARFVGKDSEYSKFVKKYNKITSSIHDISGLAELCNLYGKSIKIDSIKEKITDEINLIEAKYPMIRYCSSSAIADNILADYIKLVDKQEKVNE